MSIKDIFSKLTSGLQEYIQNEKELLKLKIIKEVAGLLGIVFSAVFIIMLFHIAIALGGLWLGFWISSLLGSYAFGFGLTSLVYLVWLTISVVFRKTLLIKPFTSLVISAMTDDDDPDETQDHEQQTT